MTAATNIPMAILATAAVVCLYGWRAARPVRAAIWIGMFGSLALASALGVFAHGLALDPSALKLMWRFIYGALALTVTCFAAGTVHDAWGLAAARRVFPALLVLSAGFWFYASFLAANFLPFILYEGVAMLFCLAVYAALTVRHQLAGAEWITVGVLLTILAAVLQATRVVTFVPLAPMDHNSVFHMTQCVALPCLLVGLQKGFDQRPIRWHGPFSPGDFVQLRDRRKTAVPDRKS